MRPRNRRRAALAVPGLPGAAGRARGRFTQLATRAATALGSPWSFLAALGAVLAWTATGPYFGYSATWQLVVNTATTIVTFLMVFLIQHTQNRDALAIQLKLNELIAAVGGASNELIDVERLSDEDLRGLQARFEGLLRKLESARSARESHSIAEVRVTKARSG